MRYFFYLTLLLFLPAFAFGQDAKLAQQYYRDGEFEKAAIVYKKLHQKQGRNDYYFDKYIECLLASEAFGEAENALKTALKSEPKNVRLYVLYGNVYERQFKEAEAEEQYQKAIKKMPADQYQITRLASTFSKLTKYDLAVQTYEKGGELIKDKQVFAFNLAELYRRKGDIPKMIQNYLATLASYPERLNTVERQLQRYLGSDDDYLELQTQLYEKVQDAPDSYQFLELLQWNFVQKKDYRNALRQAKALDKRLGENGARIFQLANTASIDKDYDAAIKAYDYIVESVGKSSAFYLDAKRESLRARRNKLVEGYSYTEAELREIEAAYETFLDEFGRNKTTASITAELADLEAFYLNDLEKAIALLDKLIKYPGINTQVQSKAKISLGDFYLMKGEIWEATLLYSQVDKRYPNDHLGNVARFKNAKLSYYHGDFQWAQSQFDVLKAATSKLIANDALDLSIFIMDNLGLDSTDQALRLYAESDLLTFQNRFDEAFRKLDSLMVLFPEHSLEDDVLYSKAAIYLKLRKYEKAAELYAQIVEKSPDEIRADNALFALAELNENQLNNTEKAMEYYEKVFIDYSNSTFAVEARKRFRRLRGDNI
ncbi:MAG TPA: tetratricopeptide repeat protein [Bacteroidetes bacterium]|nr:tetratricopeptide repeat protein [Bacteroidota bacterium]